MHLLFVQTIDQYFSKVFNLFFVQTIDRYFLIVFYPIPFETIFFFVPQIIVDYIHLMTEV